jgi:hypothetical protein
MAAMTIKVHAGDWGETTAAFGPGWTGRYSIAFANGFFSISNEYFVDTDISSVEIVTEENSKRVLGTAGWGIAGATLLGPIGLLAGLLLGGKGKKITFVCQFKDGKKILATTDNKTFNLFQMPVLKMQFNAETVAPDQPTKSEHPVVLCQMCGEPNITYDTNCIACGAPILENE